MTDSVWHNTSSIVRPPHWRTSRSTDLVFALPCADDGANHHQVDQLKARIDGVDLERPQLEDVLLRPASRHKSQPQHRATGDTAPDRLWPRGLNRNRKHRRRDCGTE